jgi:hypothetical protein
MYLECITDLYQLNLANFAYGGLVLDFSHFFYSAPDASKNDADPKSGQKRLKNNYLPPLA